MGLIDALSLSFPILFYKPKSSLIGPEAAITVPKVTQPVDKHLPDWEVELTIVIGRPAKDIKESEALDYVLGYMTGNDVCPFLYPSAIFIFPHQQLDVIQVSSDGSIPVGIF